MDDLISRLLILVNFLSFKAYLGVVLASGGCLHALEEQVELQDDDFAAEIEMFPEISDESRLMWESMDCDDKQEKMHRAWSIFAGCGLDQQGLAMIEFVLPNSRACLPTFRTNCPDGSHFAQMGSYFAQKTTTSLCSLLSRH